MSNNSNEQAPRFINPTELAKQHATKAAAVQERLVLTNRGEHTLTVPIYNPETGERDHMFLQKGGKPKLQEGWQVDAVFAARNPSLVTKKL